MSDTLESETRTPLRWEIITGGLLILGAAVLGYFSRWHGVFGDEGDTLLVAKWLNGGYVLYSDLFSHHFPFSYYWVATWFRLAGDSLETARLSIVALQIIVALLALYLSRLYLTTGIVAFLWQCISVFYYGNLALYQSIGALLLFPLFLFPLALMFRTTVPTMLRMIVTGVLLGLILLNSPLYLFVVLVVGVGLLLARTSWRHFIAVGMGGVAPLLLYGLYLLSTNSTQDFYQDAIRFNLDIYSQYSVAARVNQIPLLFQTAITGLRIFDPSNSMFPIEFIASADRVTQWLLQGVAVKAAVIGGTVFFLIQKQWKSALFIYLFAVTTLLRGRTNFDYLSITIVGVMVVSLVSTVSLPSVRMWGRGVQGASLLVLIWLVTYAGIYRIEQPERTSYATNFERYENAAMYLHAVACNTDASLAIYPNDLYVVYYSGMRPLSRYLFMYPWVAQVGEAEVVTQLKRQPMAIVLFNPEAEVWGRKAGDFMPNVYATLQSDYVVSDNSLYRSQALVEQCKLLTSNNN